MSNKPTCFENQDLILTNCPKIEKSLSDFHKLVLLVMKTTYKKLKPKIVTYRNYKSYSSGNHSVMITAWNVSKYRAFSGPYFPVFGLNTEIYGVEKTPYLDTFHAVDSFRKALQKIVFIEDNWDANFGNFIPTCNRILDQLTPQKKRDIKDNQSPFMNKTLPKI